MSVVIDERAVVHPGAELGTDVVVGPYCVIEDGVSIGDSTRLEPFVQIKSHTSLGSGNHVHSHAVLGGEPQHLGFKGEPTTVDIGDNNVIREFVTVHRGTARGLGYSRVGSGCMLMAYVHVAHDCELGDHVIMANASSLAGHVEIGDHAVISGMSGVHQFVRIGEHAFLGAMGGFGMDVPPFVMATGVRASLHGVNVIGLKRNGYTRDAISALKKAYQLIFRSDRTREEALDEVQADLGEHPEVMRLVDFIRSSKRGVTPAAANGNGFSEE
ncbi:acyl-ACP--UDP-N-acetylglucosamine O-acyltransferase [Desulfohalovibrio reitneri]|uniref:acyl-ACP--UDP-N-acetylglucosamine O-acyltransferase n=1 Tax=Desulfohalovibrio reitneri TaxID=1307759 RepID=UPI0004A7437C|nr:acyl-ACP--UDP-N-acetylglucosamine O-acyltransferase [Desulfohalovibrio reitneri]